MEKLIYIILPLLFLNPNLKKASKSEQIFRYILGFIYTFVSFYLLNLDKSLSAVISNLKWIALIQIVVTFITGMEEKGKKFNSIAAKLLLVYLVIFIFSIGYSLSPYIYGGAKNLSKLAEVKESEEQSPEINTENIIIIPPETAYYQMQTLIGSLPNPSLYKVGQLNLTRTSKGAYYVAPVEIEGTFKALMNRSLPGVLYVSAEKLEDAKLIEVNFKHGDSLLFNNNIYRKLRDYKQSSVLLNSDIELDDDMNPYYVGSYGHYKYGRNGIIVDGVLVYNLNDGEIKDYSLSDAPAWVDQIYTSEVAEKYNNYFGRLQNGYINSRIGQKGVHIPTEWSADIELEGFEIESKQVVPVVGSNGELYYFTDHTNTSNTSTTMTGYTLMNTRSGEMTYYKTPGLLNGQGAMNTIEKLIGANKSNWTPAQPILYNLYDVDTWIVPVINKADGSFVKIGLVTAQSKYAILADNKVDLIEQFKKALAEGKVNSEGDVKVSNSEKLKEVEVQGKILRINQTVEEGKSTFYIKLDTEKDKVFMVNKNISADIVLARDGDNVKIKYIDMESQSIQGVTDFEITYNP